MSLGHTVTKSNSSKIHEEHHSSLSRADISVTGDLAVIIYEFSDYDYLITGKCKTSFSGKFPFFHFIFIYMIFNAVCVFNGKY